jgi:hypothetical protein
VTTTINWPPPSASATAKTRRIVRRQWWFICRLGAALLQYQELTYDDTLRVLGWTAYSGTP